MEFVEAIQHLKKMLTIPIWASKCKSHVGYVLGSGFVHLKAALSVLLIHFSSLFLDSLSPCHFSSLRSISCTHSHTCTYTAPQWRDISSCPINRCRRTKIEHVSSSAVQRWQGIHQNGPSPFPHPVFSWPAALPGAVAHHPCRRTAGE